MTKYLLFFLMICSVAAVAQSDKTLINAQAKEFSQALLEGDYKTLAKYTYPKTAEPLGGVDRMLKVAKAGREDLEAQGIILQSVVVGEITEPVQAGDQFHCIVSQTIVIKNSKGTVTAENYLLAVSTDARSHWYFIDTTDMSMNAIKELFPNYNPELVITSRKPPVFKSN